MYPPPPNPSFSYPISQVSNSVDKHCTLQNWLLQMSMNTHIVNDPSLQNKKSIIFHSNRSYFAYKLLFILYSNVILENFPKEKHILNWIDLFFFWYIYNFFYCFITSFSWKMQIFNKKRKSKRNFFEYENIQFICWKSQNKQLFSYIQRNNRDNNNIQWI